MAKVTEFDNILSDCLDRLIKGKTVESCLKSYPHYAAELEPLLKTAQETITATAIEPSTEFRQRAAHEFQAVIRNLPAKQQHGWAFKWQLRWALPVVILLVLLGSGSGTVVAATNSLPDSPLYSLKMAAESVQLAFTFSDEGKAELYARFIDYRVEEIVKMVEKGDVNLVTLVTERMNGNIQAMAALELVGDKALFAANAFGLMSAERQTQTATEPSSGDGKGDNLPTTITTTPETATPLTGTNLLIQRLLEDMDHNLQILRDQLEAASGEFRDALQHAIDVIEEGYWQIINNLG